MEDSPSEPEAPLITIPPENRLYAFCTGAIVKKPAEIVFLEFGQMDASSDPPDNGVIVGRFVFTAALARQLRDHLSDVLDTADG